MVLQEKAHSVIKQAKTIIFGQDELLESIVAALVCEGHLLIEGLPGLGKTLSVSVMSKLCDLNFQRIQFTPDLLPSDLIGTMMYNQQKQEFSTKFGPIFTQLVLADEINRSPAKVQAALLEAMAEKQVTIGDKTHKLPTPFVVLATQNPIEQEGTYNLPEAQLDRFMMKISVDYPDFEAEKSVLGLKPAQLDLKPVINQNDLFEMKEKVEQVYVDEKIKDMIIRIVHATRPGSKFFLKKYDGAIIAGASPRASIWLFKIAKFKAFMEGKDFVSPDHLLSIVPSVLGHRVIPSYEAQIDKLNTRNLVATIAANVI
ncbi:AAA family ATPase [Peredibacter starrii]|uniref:MoxR family ATPase n=1 Tax=Peredibacter starrii TaxID=28202 RepID=A0AAX4HQD6_9BACT|nr:MoxR family ATPase [Peredibacter starrii]WPU65519.1 MoxR family ATPase [Peredibacter starrii]